MDASTPFLSFFLRRAVKIGVLVWDGREREVTGIPSGRDGQAKLRHLCCQNLF